jgi:uncharacterized protein YegJ (DUF2314 family)
LVGFSALRAFNPKFNIFGEKRGSLLWSDGWGFAMLRTLFFGILLLVGVAIGFSRHAGSASAERPEDHTLNVRTDDAAVNAAKDQGRATVDQFLARLQNPAASESDFSVKYDLTHQGGRGDGAELIWASDLHYVDGKLSGRLADEPETAGYRFGQHVDIDKADIIDWAIKVNGKYDGHFTTRALMKHMAPEEAAQVKAFLGG